MRKAFVMSINPGSAIEYTRRHNPIWPELETILKAHGVRNYSIFLLPKTHQLIAYAEIESEAKWDAIAATPACRRWWRHMADLMPHNPDTSPITEETVEVFHLD
jgi:L-rhamnose mutarotase